MDDDRMRKLVALAWFLSSPVGCGPDDGNSHATYVSPFVDWTEVLPASPPLDNPQTRFISTVTGVGEVQDAGRCPAANCRTYRFRMPAARVEVDSMSSGTIRSASARVSYHGQDGTLASAFSAEARTAHVTDPYERYAAGAAFEVADFEFRLTVPEVNPKPQPRDWVEAVQAKFYVCDNFGCGYVVLATATGDQFRLVR